MKRLISLLCFLTFTGIASAQTTNRCGTQEYMDLKMQQDPGLAARMLANEQQLQQVISAGRMSSVPITIRVVVHVVWNTPIQNISEAQILSQIEVLNEDYSRTNADTTNTPSVFQPVAADVGIQFCLAGINRVQTADTSFGINDDVKSSATGGADQWDPTQYFNIWVCNISGGVLGFSQFPGGQPLTYGTVIHYEAFGRVGTLSPPYHLGRIATHEIAHAFNLRHIWGDVTCGNDLVSDTPIQQYGNFGCLTFPTVTCSNGPDGDMFMNFMDYSDDACMNLFTYGQGVRMNAAIMNFVPGIIATGVCGSLRKISGSIYFDVDQNGVQGAGEPGMVDHSVLNTITNTVAFSNTAGIYKFYVDSGSHHLEPLIPNNWFITSDSATYTLNIDSMDVCCQDFGIAPDTIFNDVSMDITSGIMRCGFTVPFWITIENNGTTIANGVINFLKDDSMNFVSSVPVATVSGDTLSWNYNNLFPGQSFMVSMQMQLPVNPGLVLCNFGHVTFVDGPTSTIEDEDQYCDTITCSWDPNDKSVTPAGILASHYVLKTDTLDYMIRFQNEGNDTAFTVILRDQLSGFFDLSSFEIISSSHPVNVSIDSQGLAEFRFENILLPWKAINDLGSQGFVKFSLIPQPGLPDGTVIDNEAGIYFDFNPPVITNNTFVTLVTTLPVGIEESSTGLAVAVYPQPFTGIFEARIHSDDPSPLRYCIYSIDGRKLAEGISDSGSEKRIVVDGTNWHNGMMILHIYDASGRIIGSAKLLKQ